MAAVVLLPATCKRVCVCVCQTQHRWQQDISEELVKGPWTAEEDQKVQLDPNFAEDCKIEAKTEKTLDKSPPLQEEKRNLQGFFQFDWTCSDGAHHVQMKIIVYSR